MQLKRDSRIVRWAYFGEQSKVPARTSFCVIFWRTVFLTPVRCLMPIYFVAAVLYLIWRFILGFSLALLLKVLLFALAVVVGVLVVFGLVLLVQWCVGAADRRLRLRDRAARIQDSQVWQGLSDMKRGICPIVDIK